MTPATSALYLDVISAFHSWKNVTFNDLVAQFPIQDLSASVIARRFRSFSEEYDPNGVDEAWHIAQNGEKDIEPEMPAQPNFQEDAQWRNKNRKDEATTVNHVPSEKTSKS
jgi:hypothetical protein